MDHSVRVLPAIPRGKPTSFKDSIEDYPPPRLSRLKANSSYDLPRSSIRPSSAKQNRKAAREKETITVEDLEEQRQLLEMLNLGSPLPRSVTGSSVSSGSVSPPPYPADTAREYMSDTNTTVAERRISRTGQRTLSRTYKFVPTPIAIPLPPIPLHQEALSSSKKDELPPIPTLRKAPSARAFPAPPGSPSPFVIPEDSSKKRVRASSVIVRPSPSNPSPGLNSAGPPSKSRTITSSPQSSPSKSQKVSDPTYGLANIPQSPSFLFLDPTDPSYRSTYGPNAKVSAPLLNASSTSARPSFESFTSTSSYDMRPHPHPRSAGSISTQQPFLPHASTSRARSASVTMSQVEPSERRGRTLHSSASSYPPSSKPGELISQWSPSSHQPHEPTVPSMLRKAFSKVMNRSKSAVRRGSDAMSPRKPSTPTFSPSAQQEEWDWDSSYRRSGTMSPNSQSQERRRAVFDPDFDLGTDNGGTAQEATIRERR